MIFTADALIVRAAGTGGGVLGVGVGVGAGVGPGLFPPPGPWPRPGELGFGDGPDGVGWADWPGAGLAPLPGWPPADPDPPVRVVAPGPDGAGAFPAPPCSDDLLGASGTPANPSAR
jgi:hypothetical protein